MKFDTKKCNIMSISRSETPVNACMCTMNDTVHGEVSCIVLTRVLLLTTDITWASHISTGVKKANSRLGLCAKKANSRLGFIKRNLKGFPVLETNCLHISLLRSFMEYSSVVWDPHLKKDKDVLERVQRRATRWIYSSYSQRSMVSP